MSGVQVVPQELPINRDLLNPQFEGYKLSLEEIKIKEIKMPGPGVLEVKLADDQFSYQQIRAFSQINSLVSDPWNKGAVYWITTDLQIMGFNEGVDSITGASILAQIPKRLGDPAQVKEFHVGLSFPDASHAIVADGAGRLLQAHTPHRSTMPQEPWTVEPIDYSGSESAIMVATTTWKQADSDVFEVILLTIEETVAVNRDSSSSHKEFQTVLEWLTIKRGKENSWIVDRTRVLNGKTVPNYVAIEAGGKALLLSGESPFEFVSDTAKAVDVSNEAMDVESVPEVSEAVQPVYTWKQTAEHITAQFEAPSGLTAQQLHFSLTTTTIQLVHDSGKVLLEGSLFGLVDTDQSSFTVDNNKVQVVLRKSMPERWMEVVLNDARGREVFSDEELAAVAERFAGITSDKWVTQQDVNMTNPEQLEECDYLPEDTACWIRLDGESHRTTHKIDISGHQFLFSATLDPHELPAICLRHDVDGILLRPTESNNSAEPAATHVGTFSALGYVMASKRDKKFASCAPNMSFAALCDGDRNVYVYRNDAPIDSVLLNRKTAKVVKTIAKQYVLSLEKVGRIVGFAVSDASVFVLKPDALLVATL
ncbi:NudC domain-containing protein 1 [Hypsibius exemplaris]|uniref:NudC domain-containing protein 1 n=1 Tax=Hypsibius exemplaris TaxID=2072580 RepID=A0A1W0X1S5_HYPEX|nr:NudC domain-containing protein 1 [Hypsibius exemplaris]